MRYFRRLPLLLLALLAAASSSAEVERRSYETRRVNGVAPVVDGVLDDQVWDSVEWSGGFVQRDPEDGAAPSKETRFKVVYDDEALYFAFQLDDDPALMSDHLERRDHFPGDWIEVNIDSYRDRRTAFSFTLSLSGSRGDELISEDGNNWDSRWDPVWGGATHKTFQGWTAETRIPLSQLRFSDAAEQTWGLQVTRRVFRLEERTTWQRIPKDSAGWVSQFGELRGLRGLEPKRRIELLPYAVARAVRFEEEPGDPFRTGRDNALDGGLDGKIGVSSALTLDLTVNPDFGQVEADPSEVNLSAFETFFTERRPFFIEGRDIFDLRLAPAITGGAFTRDNLFYSRRIGRPPAYQPVLGDEEHADLPDNATILGAFKLSGKTAGGLSVGLLESATAEERAAIDADGVRSHATVEPFTNFFVGRLQQDFSDGDTQLGGMVTAVHRKIDDDHLGFLNEAAYAGGVDFATYFRDRDYRLEATLVGSEIRGSEEAILVAQRSSARYYQRPDNDAASFDPTATSLSGHAGSVRFGRSSNYELRFQTGVAWRSPGFEINDLGFMRSADQINQFTWVGYDRRNPIGPFDNYSVNGNQWLDWDTAGNFLGARFNVNAHAQLRSKIGLHADLDRTGDSLSNTELRGGPASRWPGRWAFQAWVNGDRRKRLALDFGGNLERGDEDSFELRRAWAQLTYRPTDAVRVSLQPTWIHRLPEMQYIGTRSFGNEPRYLFGALDQTTWEITLRLDYSITPNLTIQYYGAPFLSSGRYSELKRITDPRASHYRERFALYDAGQLGRAADGSFEVDEDRDGVVDYGFSDPDFDVRELSSNLVVRWELRPGSTLFVVWSQARSESELYPGELRLGRGLDRLFGAPSEDVFLVKVSRWLSF